MTNIQHEHYQSIQEYLQREKLK